MLAILGWPFRPIVWLWQRTPWHRKVALVALTAGLAVLVFGIHQVFVERAFRSPHRATALVTDSVNVTFPEKGSSFIEVDFTPAGSGPRHLRIDRVIEPLPRKGDHIDIEYARARWSGLVGQQAGYGAHPEDGAVMRDLGATVAAAGALLLAWTVFRPTPPEWFKGEFEVHPAPGFPPGPPDWSHRLRRPDPPQGT